MSFNTRLADTFEGALKLPLTECTKYVIFSDCHRGTGSGNDNFTKNELLFVNALKYYASNGFTYLELGDGDELWENRTLNSIKEMHAESFEMMSDFYHRGKFYSVYGNHDIVKRSPSFSQKYFCSYYCEHNLCHKPLFPNITFYPGIILEDQYEEKNIYLTHGHQTDLLNSTLWPLSRFLVRYIWKPLEAIGLRDPTSAAKNNTRKKFSEKKLTQWAKKNNHILITGHTHRPMIGTIESPYFNCGSCVSPAGITCIEVQLRCITLIKWTYGVKSDSSLYIKRIPLGNTFCIDNINP